MSARALPEKYRLARNLEEGYEVVFDIVDGVDIWTPIVSHWDVIGPIPLVSMVVRLADGDEVRLPAVARDARVYSRRPAS